MAQQLDWMIVPRDLVAGDVVPAPQHTYDLLNLTVGEALCYGERNWGINLRWCDPAKTDNIRFQKQNGATDPIKFDEPVAINVRAGKWLVYQKGRNGINLGWSDAPKFEWLIKGEPAGTPLVSGNQVGLFSTVENDYLMYESRDWGINLKWLKDAGEYMTFTKLRKSLPGQAIEWFVKNKVP